MPDPVVFALFNYGLSGLSYAAIGFCGGLGFLAAIRFGEWLGIER